MPPILKHFASFTDTLNHAARECIGHLNDNLNRIEHEAPTFYSTQDVIAARAKKRDVEKLFERLQGMNIEPIDTGSSDVEPTNEQRAARGEHLIVAYIDLLGGDEDNALQDALSDLMHYAKSRKINFEDTERVARDNYMAEELGL